MDRCIYTRVDLDNEIEQYSDTLRRGDVPQGMVQFFVLGHGTYVVGRRVIVGQVSAYLTGSSMDDLFVTTPTGNVRINRYTQVGDNDLHWKILQIQKYGFNASSQLIG